MKIMKMKKYEEFLNESKYDFLENNPELVEICKWVIKEYGDSYLEDYFNESAIDYASDHFDDYLSELGYEEDSEEWEEAKEELDAGEVYKNYAMGGAITYDLVQIIEDEIKEKYPKEWEKEEDFLREFVLGYVGKEEWDSLTNGSTEDWEYVKDYLKIII
jgi:hypothetical protein